MLYIENEALEGGLSSHAVNNGSRKSVSDTRICMQLSPDEISSYYEEIMTSINSTVIGKSNTTLTTGIMKENNFIETNSNKQRLQESNTTLTTCVIKENGSNQIDKLINISKFSNVGKLIRVT